MKRTTEKQRQAVLKLDGAGRCKHFVKTVAAFDEAWGLRRGGWVSMRMDDGTAILPLWPAREYAELHLVGEWSDARPERIGLPELLELLPKLKAEGVLPGIFPTPDGKGVTPSVDELIAAFHDEREQYE